MTLSIAYFPPVEYFAVLARYSTVFMEACENYQKQSYRNRCRIAGSNGILDLNFPVQHVPGRGVSVPIRDILVDWSTPWLRKTKTAIDSAYRSSAFFDYYRDSLYAVLDRKPETLWELDMSVISYFLEKTGLRTEIVPTSERAADVLDIHPKRPGNIPGEFGIARPYYQVFSEKFGFVPGLSIMDLVFNEGPAALDYLR